MAVIFLTSGFLLINYLAIFADVMKTKTFAESLLLLLFTALISSPLAAAESGADFVNMNPQGTQTVCSVAQDGTGMIWAGSESGLYSYDGYSFNACFEQGGRSNTRIHAILVQGETLFLGTDNGLLLYSLRTGRYTETDDRQTHEIRALCMYGGQLLCGAATGIFRYDKKSNTVKRVPLNISNVYTLLPQGRDLLVGALSGLYEVSGGRCRLVPVRDGRQPLVNAMLDDGSGGVWIGTEGELYHKPKGRPLQTVRELHGNSVKALAFCRRQVFAGTDNGLYSLDAQGKTTHSTHDSRDGSSIANNIVWALAADKHGNLWAGTDNGLSLSTNGGFGRIVRLSSLTGNGDGNCLYDILREADGTTWLGGSNGLIRYSPATGDPWSGGTMAWFRQNSATTHLAHNRVRRIYKDRQGDILICTDHGINLYDRRSGKLRNFIVSDQSGRYTTAWAYDIVQDEAGRYWISAYMGGVFMISKARLLASAGRAMADRHFSAGLQSIHVGRMALDKRGKLWLQLYENGLDRIDTRSFRIEHILRKKANLVNFVAADNCGDVWTAGPSVVRRFPADGGSGEIFRLQDSPSRRITAMCAAKGCVYALTGQECLVFASNGESSRFAVPGDIKPQSLWYDDATQSLLLGGNDALAVLPADRLNGGGTQRLALSSVTVNGKPFRPEGCAVSQATELRLTSTQNNIELSLTDMPYAGRRKDVYAYFLEGASRTWQYLRDGALDITFNALPHGDYTLKVCKVDGQGRAAASVFGLKIHVLPPWYLSMWAKLLYAAAIAGLCLWGMNFYLMKKRLAHERQARKQVMEQSKARAAFYAGLSRRLKAPLSKIMSQAGQLLHNETDAGNALGIESIRQRSAEMSRLVYETLSQAAVEAPEQDRMTCSETIDVVDFCRRTIADVRKENVAGKPEISFHTDTPIIYIAVDVPGFYPPFRSFISKAAETAGDNGTVRLSVSADSVAGQARISLEMPERTIPKERLPFVFYRYKQSDGKADDNGKLNELAALKDFAEHAGGSFNVESDEESGTKFLLSLPCKSASARQKTAQLTAQKAHAKAGTALKNEEKATTDMTDSGLLDLITSVIEEHISDSEFNVTKLAACAGIGDKSLYRRIKQLTGKTPVELIRQIRMQRASLLLREGKFSVSEVMYLVGFQNSSYFSKCFAKAYGITPAEYSKKASL